MLRPAFLIRSKARYGAGYIERLSAYAAFRFPDYRRLFSGMVLSALGSQMLATVVSWDLYQQTRSPIVLGNVGLVQVLPVLLLTLVAGHVADRYERRRTIVLSQAVIGLVAGALVLVPHRSVSMLYSALFLIAVARAFQGPSSSALVPRVIPPEALGNAIAWNSSGREIATVAGPGLAGVLLATYGSSSVYLAQAIGAVATLACFATLTPTARAESPSNSASGWQAISEGVRFVWRDKLILSAISLDLFAVLFGGATALLPIYAEEILHVGAQGLGWLRAAPSIGAVAMALMQVHLPPFRKAGPVMLWAVAGFGAATIVFGLSRSAWLSFAMLVMTGALDNISVVLRQSLVQTETPDYLRGRVLSVNSLFISCSNQLGAVESGWAAAWLGVVPSVAWGGAATIAVVLVLAMLSRPLRTWQRSQRA